MNEEERANKVKEDLDKILSDSSEIIKKSSEQIEETKRISKFYKPKPLKKKET